MILPTLIISVDIIFNQNVAFMTGGFYSSKKRKSPFSLFLFITLHTV